MPALDAAIRRSQLISTFGVGALVPVGNESFMVAGLDHWPMGPTDLSEPRLERVLGKQGFRQPPAGEHAPRVPVVRFPLFHTCPSCHFLARHWTIAESGTNRCRDCAADLVPSRFVVACDHGHIDDFPYMQWVHAGTQWTDNCKLTLTTTGVSAALRDVVVSCTCGSSRSLDGAFDRRELLQVAPRCRGVRPWLRDKEDGCAAQLRTLQRGASNVWFGETRSALSIPPWSQAAFQAISRFWPMLRNITDPEQLADLLDGMGGEQVLGAPVEELVQAAGARRADETGDQQFDETLFRQQEYDALLAGRKESGAADEFVAVPEAVPASLADHLDAVVLAHRLREVRVLVGLTRLRPPGPGSDTDRESAPLSLAPLSWLPGIEVRGEGLFLRLALERLVSWEGRDEVVDRVGRLEANRQRVPNQQDDRPVTPRFVLLHTFAHALIDMLSLDAGYPAASLRERLYVSDEMCGVLIYTATSDSAGSLGGIVQQGKPERLERVVTEAVQRYAWCSADPVCVESDAQGVDGLNLAACHACALLPETSCEERNVLLDRAVLVGTPERPDIGYFNALLG